MERASSSNPLELEGPLEKKGRVAALLLLFLFSPLRGEKRGVVFSGEFLLPLSPQVWTKGGVWESEGLVGSSDPYRERNLSLPLSRGRDYGFRLGLDLPMGSGGSPSNTSPFPGAPRGPSPPREAPRTRIVGFSGPFASGRTSSFPPSTMGTHRGTPLTPTPWGKRTA